MTIWDVATTPINDTEPPNYRGSYMCVSKSKVIRALAGVQVTHRNKIPFEDNEVDHSFQMVPIDGACSPIT
ncbi:hypothetical protein TNCV_2310031 [Trichonephila clavipes]|nr:hypothetical protein TNCV_2310031 [Trichonephila clavipes]